jgi:RNA polymerase sigma factor (sigma-70 family)
VINAIGSRRHAKLPEDNVVDVEQILLAFEPILRRIVHRQLSAPLRAKLDSMDVVQSVFADFIASMGTACLQFEDAAALRAFLLTMVRNRFIDRVRKYRSELNRERPLDVIDPDDLPASDLPRPSQVAQANDVWDKMLLACPPEHHELLRLKREGLSTAEIAARTGLHEGSIRRVLRRLARKLAFNSRRHPASDVS